MSPAPKMNYVYKAMKMGGAGNIEIVSSIFQNQI